MSGGVSLSCVALALGTFLIGVVGTSSLPPRRTVLRGSILHFTQNPFHSANETETFQYFKDGGLLIADGKVEWVGNWPYPGTSDEDEILDYTGRLIVPGFVDTHIHAPQVDMIAAFGESLLPWLNKYTFPAELKFHDKEYAKRRSDFFLKELLRAGTTTALAFATRHDASTDALFEAASERNMRIIAGQVLMDDNADHKLQDESAQQAYKETSGLIKRWHNNGRNLYAVTPRFAPTSSVEQLNLTGQLLQEHPDVYMHTHLSESMGEIDWVHWMTTEGKFKDISENYTSYLDVYDHFGLLGPRSIFAHSIHLSQAEWDLLGKTKSTVSWCPTSNNFLGSGLFNLRAANASSVRVGMGTDVGAGTSFSMLRTLGDAYKSAKLGESWLVKVEEFMKKQKISCPDPQYPECDVHANDISLSPTKAFYLATLGGATQLSIQDKIGNFERGKEADFVVLNWTGGREVLEDRMGDEYILGETDIEQLMERLFILMIMGDDRNVEATYVMGQRLHGEPLHSKERPMPWGGNLPFFP